MKRFVIATLLAACSNNADIGVNGQPVSCKPDAEGAVEGTVTNATTHKSYTFGAIAASLGTTPGTSSSSVLLQDSTLSLSLAFLCGQTDLGMYDVGADQRNCPFMANGTVSGVQQQVYGTGHSGVVIVDQNTGCLAGRYDVQLGYTMNNGTYVSEGEVTGWFSVPM